MSTSQMAVMPCRWGVKAGMVRVWMASNDAIYKALYKFICLLYFHSVGLLEATGNSASQKRHTSLAPSLPRSHRRKTTASHSKHQIEQLQWQHLQVSRRPWCPSCGIYITHSCEKIQKECQAKETWWCWSTAADSLSSRLLFGVAKTATSALHKFINIVKQSTLLNSLIKPDNEQLMTCNKKVCQLCM